MSDVPITDHVVITIQAGTPSPAAFDFGTLLVMHEVDADAFEGRLFGPISGIDEAEAEGITAITYPNLYADLQTVFAQQDSGVDIQAGVQSVLIGRKLPAQEKIGQLLVYDDSADTWTDETVDVNDAGTADVTLYPAAEEDELDFVAWGHEIKFSGTTWDSTGGTPGVGGAIALEYGRDLDSDGIIDDWVAHTGVVDGTSGFTAAAGPGQAMTWAVPDDWDAGVLDPADLGVEPPRYYTRARITTVYGTNPIYSSAFLPGDTDYSDALQAIIALHGNDAFFGVKVYDRTDAGITDLFAWAQAADLKFLTVQTDSPALKAGTPGNIGLTMKAAGYTKGALAYHRRDVDHLDSAWAARSLGTNMDGPDGRLNWKFRSLVFADGPSTHLSTTQIANIKAANVNLYGRSQGRNFMQEGVTPAGSFIYFEIFKMWAKRRLEEKALEVFANSKIIGFDSAGLAKMEAGFYEVLGAAQTFGHASLDVPPKIVMPDPRTISDTVKTSGVLTFSGSITDRGGVNKVVFTLHVKA